MLFLQSCPCLNNEYYDASESSEDWQTSSAKKRKDDLRDESQSAIPATYTCPSKTPSIVPKSILPKPPESTKCTDKYIGVPAKTLCTCQRCLGPVLILHLERFLQESKINDIVQKLRNREECHTMEISLQTTEVLRLALAKLKTSSSMQLLQVCYVIGYQLVEANQYQFVIINIIHRILGIIRRLHLELVAKQSPSNQPPPSNYTGPKLSTNNTSHRSNQNNSATRSPPGLKMASEMKHITSNKWFTSSPVKCQDTVETNDHSYDMDRKSSSTSSSCNKHIWNIAVNMELLRHLLFEDLEDVIHDIKQEWVPKVNSLKDLFFHVTNIMIYGSSDSVFRTLRQIRLSLQKKRRDIVLWCVGGDALNRGQEMALKLHKECAELYYIHLAAANRFIGHCEAVILGSIIVLANGSAVTVSGGNVIAAAAKASATPLYIVTSLYKVSPIQHFDFKFTNELLPYVYGDTGVAGIRELEGVSVEAGRFDCIKADYVSAYVTNVGDIHPSVIYQCVKHWYYAEDMDSYWFKLKN